MRARRRQKGLCFRVAEFNSCSFIPTFSPTGASYFVPFVVKTIAHQSVNVVPTWARLAIFRGDDGFCFKRKDGREKTVLR